MIGFDKIWDGICQEYIHYMRNYNMFDLTERWKKGILPIYPIGVWVFVGGKEVLANGMLWW